MIASLLIVREDINIDGLNDLDGLDVLDGLEGCLRCLRLNNSDSDNSDDRGQDDSSVRAKIGHHGRLKTYIQTGLVRGQGGHDNNHNEDREGRADG